MGLWAKIEKAVYDGLESKPVDGQESSREEMKGGLDGYHREFVANIER